MAAGKVDVTRRENVIYSSNSKSVFCRNGFQDLGFSRDYDGKVNRSKNRYGDEITRFEDEEPKAKRTKLSPIGKEIRVLSRSRIVKKRTPPTPPKSCEKIDSFIDDDLSDGLKGEKISSFEARLNDGSMAYSNPECLASSGRGDDEAEVVSISKSRWANEDYSPSPKRSSDNGSCSSRGRAEVDSPESGEIRENNKFSGSGSSERANDEIDFTESELKMEIDEVASVPRSVNMFQSCRSVCEYERLGKISEGTYGIVYKARDKKTGEIVALKKVKMGREREGFPLTALREIKLLSALHHPSIIDVKEVVMDDFDDVYMVMEYMEYDLKKLVEVMKQPFSEKEVKCLMLQLLEGIKDLHDNWILHRDLKTSNILISKNGTLKICDLGMSRQFGDPLKRFTTLVVTLWYRAPELLLGAKRYSTAVDMWSVGCIMAELLAKKPLFDGDNEVRQLDKIFSTLGTPNEATWPGLANLPGSKARFVKQPINTLRSKFPALSFNGSPVLSERGFDLLSQLLTYNPKKRISVDDALAHGWFEVESKQELQSAQESLAMKIKTMMYVK